MEKMWNSQHFVSAGSNSNQRGSDDTDDQGLLTPASREKHLKGIPVPPASLSCLPRVSSESWSGTISVSQPVLFHRASTTCWGHAWGFNSINRTFQTSRCPLLIQHREFRVWTLIPLVFLHFPTSIPVGWCSTALSRDRFQLLQPALSGCTPRPVFAQQRFVIPSTLYPFGLHFPWAGPCCCTSDPGRNSRGFFSIPPCKCVKKLFSGKGSAIQSMLEIVKIIAGLDVLCLCCKWGGRGWCGGDWISKSVSGWFYMFIASTCCFGRKMGVSIKRIESFKWVSSKGFFLFVCLFLNLLSHLPVKSMVPPGDVESSVPEWWHLTIVGMVFLMPKSVLQFQSDGWFRTAAAGAAQPEVPEGLFNKWRQILMNLSCFL